MRKVIIALAALALVMGITAVAAAEPGSPVRAQTQVQDRNCGACDGDQLQIREQARLHTGEAVQAGDQVQEGTQSRAHAGDGTCDGDQVQRREQAGPHGGLRTGDQEQQRTQTRAHAGG